MVAAIDFFLRTERVCIYQHLKTVSFLIDSWKSVGVLPVFTASDNRPSDCPHVLLSILVEFCGACSAGEL